LRSVAFFLFFGAYTVVVRVEWFLGVDDDGLSRVPFPGLFACPMDGMSKMVCRLLGPTGRKKEVEQMGKLLSIPKRIGVALIALLMVVTVGFGVAAKANAYSVTPWSATHTFTQDGIPFSMTVMNHDPDYAEIRADSVVHNQTGCVAYQMSWFNAGVWQKSTGERACGHVSMRSTAPRIGAYPDAATDIWSIGPYNALVF
jgi:hypothetical protein